jgi:S1-C subfamily serine protease
MHSFPAHRPTDGDKYQPRPASRRRARRMTASIAAAVLALPLAVGAVVTPVSAATVRPSAVTPTAGPGWQQFESPYAPYWPDPQQYQAAPYQSLTTTGLDATDATAEQSAGLVLVSTTVDFGAGEAAGTGMVIDSSGIVVTNHHVVEGATDIEVTIASTGETYAAEVLGTDAAADVAVLRLADVASELQTVQTDTSDTSGAGVRSEVTAVGDAGGDGGALTAASGTVTALHQSITVDDDNGGSSRLRNLIEVDADIIPGDSGGALLAADGDVIGMNVAASSGSANITGYVIPIRRVLRIADAVLSGDADGTVDVGYDAFLGVQLSTTTSAPALAGTVAGSPAEAAGLSAGDTITAVDGTAVTSAAQLRRLIASHDPGETVPVTWADSDGASHTVDVTLTQGPVA